MDSPTPDRDSLREGIADLRSASHAFTHAHLPPAQDALSTRYRAGVQAHIANLLEEAFRALSPIGEKRDA